MQAETRSKRHLRILDLFDRSPGTGLEIGPLYDPVIRRGDADIKYVDVHAVDLLRAHYATHPGTPVDDIVDPDFVLIGPEGVRTLAQACAPTTGFSWVIASHVIEHVPDLISWLREVAEVLEDGGRLVLAVPDRRYSFDAARPATTVGDMLLAHGTKDKIPSRRAVYDHFSKAVNNTAANLWKGEVPTPANRIHGLDYVTEQLRLSVEEGEYVDCHVWLFTPQTFVDQLVELVAMDLIDFTVETVVPTYENELEFYAVLKRIPRDADRAASLAGGFDLTGLDAGAEPPVHVPPPVEDPISDHERQLVELKRAALLRARKSVARARRAAGR